MKKNIKRVMGILLAATMSISLVMPAFASQTRDVYKRQTDSHILQTDTDRTPFFPSCRWYIRLLPRIKQRHTADLLSLIHI